jgi:hypothetical protein
MKENGSKIAIVSLSSHVSTLTTLDSSIPTGAKKLPNRNSLEVSHLRRLSDLERVVFSSSPGSTTRHCPRGIHAGLRRTSPRVALLACLWITLQFDYGNLGWGRNGVMTRRRLLFPPHGRGGMFAEQKRGGFASRCPLRSFLYLLFHVGVKVRDKHLRLFCGAQCARSEGFCLQPNCQLGLRLLSPWMILSRGRSEPQLMPSNISKVWGIWNCRPLRWKESRSAQSRYGATVCESFDGMANIARHDRVCSASGSWEQAGSC